ncbi:MAG: hypothetical protein ACOVMM_07080 [Chitinophagaceae bacterium]
MKKLIALILICGLYNAAISQTKLHNQFSVANINKVKFVFDYPQLIKIKTWAKNEVAVSALVNINNGKFNDSFRISQTQKDDVLVIEGKIKNLVDLWGNVTINSKNSNGNQSNKNQYKKYFNNGNLHNGEPCNTDVNIDIEVTVFVPEKMSTDITSTYGLIEVQHFAAPLKATSPYKGIDIIIDSENIGKLSATTSYGEILTDVKFDIEEKVNRDFYTYFKANVGTGFDYSLASTYGKLYLRKKS